MSQNRIKIIIQYYLYIALTKRFTFLAPHQLYFNNDNHFLTPTATLTLFVPYQTLPLLKPTRTFCCGFPYEKKINKFGPPPSQSTLKYRA